MRFLFDWGFLVGLLAWGFICLFGRSNMFFAFRERSAAWLGVCVMPSLCLKFVSATRDLLSCTQSDLTNSKDKYICFTWQCYKSSFVLG